MEVFVDEVKVVHFRFVHFAVADDLDVVALVAIRVWFGLLDALLKELRLSVKVEAESFGLLHSVEDVCNFGVDLVSIKRLLVLLGLSSTADELDFHLVFGRDAKGSLRPELLLQG